MFYLPWAVYYEGGSDRAYFDVLIQRVMNDILLNESEHIAIVPDSPAIYLNSKGRSVDAVAKVICENQEIFSLVFIHADSGGRHLAEDISDRREAFAERARELCEWPLTQCIFLSPRHEMEAWALSDSKAVMSALGYRGDPWELGLPKTAAEAEALNNPKAVLNHAAKTVSPRRFSKDATQLLTIIAQEQSLYALRQASSYLEFEGSLRTGLRALGCLK